MNEAGGRSRGEQYARLFRKAGVFAGKGELAAAIAALEQGVELARRLGDVDMERIFTEQIATHRREMSEDD
ncbi:MAG TPA: hypothetical protein VL403_08660 [Candidatus Kryptonia bacterium]|nr:hypothetical protein [Candidatus Kryptonia bacterium]